MAYTTIKKPSDYFNTKLYTGNGSTQSITGVGFQPDWVWIKNRDNSYNHALFDAVRGVTKFLASNNTDAEQTNANELTTFGTDGFTTGNAARTNNNSDAFTSWNWLAANGTAANTDGSISSTVSANTTSGFSIVSYTGTGSDTTVGHGLGVTPKIVFFKRLDSSANWVVQTPLIGNEVQLVLNDASAAATDSRLGASDNWSNQVFTVGTYGDMNASGGTYIAYCFAEKQGYSKFGTYTGNGSTDGTFIYTGFKPAFVMNKMSSAAFHEWNMFDSTRQTFNPNGTRLRANSNGVEATQAANYIDLLSNGFKIRTTDGNYNSSGSSYIYMAFAEEPLVGDNPCTAR